MLKEKTWERQAGESEKAYEAFTIYRDMGEKRTLIAVAEKLHKSSSLIRRWKERWNWIERVRLYDNEIEKEVKATVVKERKSMIERHIKIAMQLQKKALEALRSLPVKKMSAKDIKDYIKIATDLERVNRMLDFDKKEDGCTNIIFKGDDEFE